MPATCHRCGASVEDGAAFCPQCGAAQIRVAASDNVPATPPMPPGTPGAMPPPAQPVAMPGSDNINWHHGIRAALLAAIIGAVPSALPVLSVGCCIWVIGGAALAVMFYQNRMPAGSVVSAGMGSRLGGVTGLFAFGFWFGLQMLSFALFNTRGKVREAMVQAMRDSAARNPDPSTQQMLERMSTPAGLATIIVVMIVVMFVAFLVFGLIGGALGSSIWGRKQQA
jgi:hypothetical protein